MRHAVVLVTVSASFACAGPGGGGDASADVHADSTPHDGVTPIDATANPDVVTNADVADDLVSDAFSDDAADANDAIVDAGTPCPPPAAGSIEGMLAWGEVLQHRMASGVIASFPVIAAPDGRSSMMFTQGQQPSTPAGVVTEFSVSRCRGVIDTSVPECYQRSVFVNYNTITTYARPVGPYVDQASLGAAGCWAPESQGPWYVNVRWTYDTCPFASCGFSLQWSLGPY